MCWFSGPWLGKMKTNKCIQIHTSSIKFNETSFKYKIKYIQIQSNIYIRFIPFPSFSLQTIKAKASIALIGIAIWKITSCRHELISESWKSRSKAKHNIKHTHIGPEKYGSDMFVLILILFSFDMCFRYFLNWIWPAIFLSHHCIHRPFIWIFDFLCKMLLGHVCVCQ